MAVSVRRLFDIRREEVLPAVLFFLLFFSIIVVFAVLKPLKTGLFIEHLGPRLELLAKLLNVGVAFAAALSFSYLKSRLGGSRLIYALAAVFAAALLGYAYLLRDGAGTITTWSFYLFGDLWTTVWITTFWAYLNDATDADQSKRLYGLIGGGATVGGLFGSLIVATQVKSVGSTPLLVGCAVATLLMAVIVLWTEHLRKRPEIPLRLEQLVAADAHDARPWSAALEGMRLVRGSNYLIAIIAMIFLYEIASQLLDYQFKVATSVLAGSAEKQAFFGQIGVIVNLLSFITQFFVVSFTIRVLGMRAALLVLPVAMLVASGLHVAIPALWTAALLTISDNGLHYSMNQTSRETLWVPTSADVKYRARAFGNMFVQRFGKGVAIVMALALSALPIRSLAVLTAVVVAVWMGCAWYAGREFQQLTDT